jgi:exosome complex RNA-binding protein Rrp4
MVQNKATMKRYDNKESDQNNHKFDFVHDVVNPNFKTKGMSYVSGKSSLEMRNDNLPKAKVNLAEAKGDNIIGVISHVKLTDVSKWAVDSGATSHICVNRDAFTSYTIPGDNKKLVYLTDSQTASVYGKGKILLKLTSGKTLALTNVLHVPSIKKNLISMSLLTKNGVNVSFGQDYNDKEKYICGKRLL